MSLEKLKRLFSRNSAQVPAIVTKQDIVLSEWGDDAPLRELARASHDGKTNWVLGLDMMQFYQQFDAYNNATPQHMRARLVLPSDKRAILQDYIERGLHLSANLNFPEGNGPIVLQGELGLRALGPQGVSMAFEVNGKHLNANYSADPFNTNINIQTPNGWVRLDFGLSDPFSGAPKPERAFIPGMAAALT